MTTILDPSTGISQSAAIAGGSVGALNYQVGPSSTGQLPVGSSGQILQSGGAGSAPTWAAVPSGSSSNITGGVIGSIPYQTSAGATAFLAPGTAGQQLTSNGAGAPTWTNPPTSAVAYTYAGAVSAATLTLTEADYGKVWRIDHSNPVIYLPTATPANVGKVLTFYCAAGILQTSVAAGQTLYTLNRGITYGTIGGLGQTVQLMNYNGASWVQLAGQQGLGSQWIDMTTYRFLNGVFSVTSQVGPRLAIATVSLTYWPAGPNRLQFWQGYGGLVSQTSGGPVVVQTTAGATITATVMGFIPAQASYSLQVSPPSGATLVSWYELDM